jgi:hypothetical protein
VDVASLQAEAERLEGLGTKMYLAAMERFNEGRVGMTVAEAIGLPRMFRDRWGLDKHVLQRAQLRAMSDRELAWARMDVAYQIASSARWRYRAALGEHFPSLVDHDDSVLRENFALLQIQAAQLGLDASATQVEAPVEQLGDRPSFRSL